MSPKNQQMILSAQSRVHGPKIFRPFPASMSLVSSVFRTKNWNISGWLIVIEAERSGCISQIQTGIYNFLETTPEKTK
ncbi:MAG: hypothetical protein QME69_10730 [Candidatus Saccharicenans sp.]|nr:hypothetical protein [Candidatus Saccharicenans sp.]